MEPTPAENTPSSNRTIHRVLVGAGLLTAVALAVAFLPVREPIQRFLEWSAGLGVQGMVVFGLLYVAGSLVFVPGSLLTLGAGYAFDVVWGTILVSAASTTGAVVAFLIGRYLARDWVEAKIADSEHFRAIDSALGDESFKVVFLLRLVPLLPFTAMNYAFGASQVSFRRYVAASWLGMLPATVMYVYFGSLAEKATRLAAATSGDSVPVWAVGETIRRLAAGDFATGALENLAYWLGFVAVVAVTWIVTSRARAELERITRDSEET